LSLLRPPLRRRWRRQHQSGAVGFCTPAKSS